MSDRPTSSCRAVVVDLFDDASATLELRLAGLTSDEMAWEPVARCWSVRPPDDPPGSVIGVVDAATEHYEADPPLVTTIGWRLWHLAVDCLDAYSSRLLGSVGASVVADRFPLDADRAVAELAAAGAHFRSGVGAMSDDELWSPLGEQWGPYARHNVLDLVQHASHELTHHGAEIGLLRDLFRARSPF